MWKKQKRNQCYGIIGLGRFGYALAESLAESGNDLIVVDKKEDIVNQASSLTNQAYQISNLTQDTMQQIGLQSCDVIIVGVGERMDVSILITLYALQLGVERVIAKATSEEHGSVLETLGAEVVYPERDMAIRLARRLQAPGALEYISLSDEVDITEIIMTEKIRKLPVAELDIRKRFGLNIIAVKRGADLRIDITPDLILNEGMTITVIGKKDDIAQFEAYLS